MVGDPSPGWPVRRVVAVADRDEAGGRALPWALSFAARSGAALRVVEVLEPAGDGAAAGTIDAARIQATEEQLRRRVADLMAADADAKAAGVLTDIDVRVVVDADPASAIVRVSDEDRADVIVVGNAGMRGRRELLAGSVANRVSHAARATVIIVDEETDGTGRRQAAGPLPREARGVADPERAGWLSARGGRIAMIFARHGLVGVLAGGDDDPAQRAARARGLRAALEELGPTFAKLGQLLSTRPDLVPPEYVAELASLQDRMPPLAEGDVARVLEEELGVPWEDVFETLDPAPLAAGTIAQVHRATLSGGERVVVKIQRPSARSEIEQDLALLEVFAEKAQARPGLSRMIDVGAVFEHLSTSLHRELDFRQEAANIERLRGILGSYPHLGVPGVRAELSSGRLLVMEEIRGFPVSQAPASPARSRAAHELLESYYQQIMVDGFFHADPHPGNLMWCDDRIYFLDCGMVGVVDAETRGQLVLLLLAFWQGDAPFLTDVALTLAGANDRRDVDVPALQADLAQVVERYRGASLREIQLGPVLADVTAISMRHGVRLPAALALAGKAMSQMQLVTAELAPELDPFEIAGRFLMRNSARAALAGLPRQLDPRLVYYRTQRMRVRAGHLLSALERLVGARPGPKLELSFRATRLEEAVRTAGRRLTLGIVAASSLLGLAFTATSDRVAGVVPAGFAAVSALFVAWLVLDLVRGRD